MRKFSPELTVINWKHRHRKGGIFKTNNLGCPSWENHVLIF